MVLIAPSLLAADQANLADAAQLAQTAGADWLHFDIMDGHFVPNLSFGPALIKSLRGRSNLFFDVHLMVQNPEQFLPMFENCGADLLTVHLESGNDIMSVLRKIKDNNIKAGLSLKPQTGAKTLVPYLDLLDNILVMTVNPGFGGQKFMEDQLEKISEISKIIKGRNITIEVDGGINLETAELCVKHGANVLVAGNFIFGAPNPMEMIKKLQNIGEK